jgi:hypothetical protein
MSVSHGQSKEVKGNNAAPFIIIFLKTVSQNRFIKQILKTKNQN